MHSDDPLQDWLWVVLLALQVHWYILDRLKAAGLLKRWSVDDVLRELREIRKEPVPTGWQLTPVSQGVRKEYKTQKLVCYHREFTLFITAL